MEVGAAIRYFLSRISPCHGVPTTAAGPFLLMKVLESIYCFKQFLYTRETTTSDHEQQSPGG
jgi:hypothetical protein